MATLSYSGRIPIDTNADGTVPQAERDKLNTLLDEAITAYEGDQVVLRTAVVHFERGNDAIGTGDLPRAQVEVEANGDLGTLATVEDTLAQQVVQLGLEPDTETAKEAIQVE
jgi:hypothetical protein